jgi:hypothetical protein
MQISCCGAQFERDTGRPVVLAVREPRKFWYRFLAV